MRIKDPDGTSRDATPEEEARILAEAVPVEIRPRVIHPAWLRLALIEIGKLDAVNAAVTSQGATKQALWEYATTIAENDPDVSAIATALGINLATLFDRANEIRVSRNG